MFATPILDLEQNPTAPPQRWRLRLLGAAIGICIAAVPILADQGFTFPGNWPAFNGLLLLPAVLFAIAVHEIGHLVAGKLAGLKMGGLSIGPLGLTKSGRHWTVSWQWRLFGGFYKPLTGTRELRAANQIWMIAGGPLTSFLLAVVCGWWIWRFGNGGWDWMGTLFWTSLLLGILALVPFSSGLHRSDGARIWRLLREPGETNRFGALLEIQTDEARGLRPGEWNVKAVEEIAAIDPSATEYLSCQTFLFYRLLDQGNEEAALLHLENALAKSGKAGNAVRTSLFLEAASACARIKNDAASARVWRQRVLPLVRNKRELLETVDASIAMSEGRYAEACELWQAARRRLVARKLDSGLSRLALDKWEEFAAFCQTRAAVRENFQNSDS